MKKDLKMMLKTMPKTMKIHKKIDAKKLQKKIKTHQKIKLLKPTLDSSRQPSEHYWQCLTDEELNQRADEECDDNGVHGRGRHVHHECGGHDDPSVEKAWLSL